MHPNTFLNNFWNSELLPQVFVAMSFDQRYHSRFEDVIRPTIEEVQVNGKALSAYRVDLSKSGDSIHTDIIDGIAHSQLILADVSVVHKDQNDSPYRNGNVMYEVGLAMASRNPIEVILIRDDDDKFLFDISAIPHKRIDFTDTEAAKLVIKNEIDQRLKEIETVFDKRVAMILSQLHYDEIRLLSSSRNMDVIEQRDTHPQGFMFDTMDRLLSKQLVRLLAVIEDPFVIHYKVTRLGRQVSSRLIEHIEINN